MFLMASFLNCRDEALVRIVLVVFGGTEFETANVIWFIRYQHFIPIGQHQSRQRIVG